MADKKSRIFTGVVYVESSDYNYDDVLKRLNGIFDEWAYCLHDMDVDSKGVIKKAHVHWLGRRTPTTIDNVASQMGLPSHQIERGKSFKALTRYLIHLDDADKYQYDKSTIVANFDVEPYLLVIDEGLQVIDLIDTTIQEQLSFYQLAVYAARNGLWSTYRRNYSIIKDIMTVPKNLWDIPASPPPRSRELVPDDTDYDIVLYK